MKLHRISPDAKQNTTLDVVFVHGLTGKWDETFEKDGFAWPKELCKARPEIMVWSLEYEAPAFRGDANNQISNTQLVLQLNNEYRAKNLGDRSFVFICHSYGGLVAKRFIRHLREQGTHQGGLDHRNFVGVLFAGTPHKGADIAKLLGGLVKAGKLVAGKAADYLFQMLPSGFSTAANAAVAALRAKVDPDVSEVIDALANSSELSDLSQDFGRYFSERAFENSGPFVVRTLAEMLPLAGMLSIVTKASADPYIRKDLDSQPLPVQDINANHFDVCKPRNVDDEIWKAGVDFLECVSTVRDLSANFSGFDDFPSVYGIYSRLSLAKSASFAEALATEVLGAGSWNSAAPPTKKMLERFLQGLSADTLSEKLSVIKKASYYALAGSSDTSEHISIVSQEIAGLLTSIAMKGLLGELEPHAFPLAYVPSNNASEVFEEFELLSLPQILLEHARSASSLQVMKMRFEAGADNQAQNRRVASNAMVISADVFAKHATCENTIRDVTLKAIRHRQLRTTVVIAPEDLDDPSLLPTKAGTLSAMEDYTNDLYRDGRGVACDLRGFAANGSDFSRRLSSAFNSSSVLRGNTVAILDGNKVADADYQKAGKIVNALISFLGPKTN